MCNTICVGDVAAATQEIRLHPRIRILIKPISAAAQAKHLWSTYNTLTRSITKVAKDTDKNRHKRHLIWLQQYNNDVRIEWSWNMDDCRNKEKLLHTPIFKVTFIGHKRNNKINMQCHQYTINQSLSYIVHKQHDYIYCSLVSKMLEMNL